MIAGLRTAWRKAPWLMGAFTLAAALTLFFGSRMILSAIYWADPSHIDEDIAGWMSPGYVAMSWDVPRELIMAATNLEPGAGRARQLEEIAAEQDVPLNSLIAQVESAIQTFRDTQP